MFMLIVRQKGDDQQAYTSC